MSDGLLGVALLAVGGWGSLVTIRDTRRTRPAGARRAPAIVSVVCLLASVLATLTGAALLVARP